MRAPREAAFSLTSPRALEQRKVDSALALLQGALEGSTALRELRLRGVETRHCSTPRRCGWGAWRRWW